MEISGNIIEGHFVESYMNPMIDDKKKAKWRTYVLGRSIFKYSSVIASKMVILGRILVFFGLVAILHAGYSAVQCEYSC